MFIWLIRLSWEIVFLLFRNDVMNLLGFVQREYQILCNIYKMNGMALCYFHGASACTDDFQVHLLLTSVCSVHICVCMCTLVYWDIACVSCLCSCVHTMRCEWVGKRMCLAHWRHLLHKIFIICRITWTTWFICIA